MSKFSSSCLDHGGGILIPQTRLEERESHIRQLEILEGNQVVEISKLKEEIKRLEGELKSPDQGMETLMVERVDLICQVMH